MSRKGSTFTADYSDDADVPKFIRGIRVIRG